jgi:hypothetical protein
MEDEYGTFKRRRKKEGKKEGATRQGRPFEARHAGRASTRRGRGSGRISYGFFSSVLIYYLVLKSPLTASLAPPFLVFW